MNGPADGAPADPDEAVVVEDVEHETSSPLHRITQERNLAPVDDPEARRATLASSTANRRYWVRLNVSPLGWVALVEQGDSRGTSALGDVLDLGGGGCVLSLSNVPSDLLTKGHEISVSVRQDADHIVTCTGQVLGWTEVPNGVQVRIAFTSADPAVHKQVADTAVAARVRLLQLAHGDD